MSSHRKTAYGSPLAHFISQWCHQQQQQQKQQQDNTSCQSLHYRVLLQSTASQETRLQAAGSLSGFSKGPPSGGEEDVIYRRAGLRTPAEMALRDLIGGYAWLVRILHIATEAHPQDDQSTRVVVFVRTQSQSCLLPNSLESKLLILNASHDPWGWDDEEDIDNRNSISDKCSGEGGRHTNISLANLSKLFQSIQSTLAQCSENTPVLLVWESLTPLFMVHGFDRTLQFLEAIDSGISDGFLASSRPILQVWSVRTETLTPMQHARLEDAASALLHLSRGEMTLIRQGIREQANVIREILPFRLVPSKNSRSESAPSSDIEGGGMSFWLKEQDDKPTDASAEEATTVNENKEDDPATGTTKSRRSKVQLRMESDDDFAKGKFNAITNASESSSNANRPRIYLQDDDPEFDDMDEEDPDDDLGL